MNFIAMLTSLLKSTPRANPAEAALRVRSGEAILVDVREPGEWARGVAESAALLPISDLHRDRKQWTPFLARADDRELLLYCASGTRSGMAARLLAGEGHRVSNAGSIGDWASIGWPIVRPKRTN